MRMKMFDIKCTDIQFKRLNTLLDKVFQDMLKNSEGIFLDCYATCGTPMCVAGHACMLPEFNNQGLELCTEYCYGRKALIPKFRDYQDDKALDEFFGKGAYTHLFDTNDSDYSDIVIIAERANSLKEFLIKKSIQSK